MYSYYLLGGPLHKHEQATTTNTTTTNNINNNDNNECNNSNNDNNNDNNIDNINNNNNNSNNSNNNPAATSRGLNGKDIFCFQFYNIPIHYTMVSNIFIPNLPIVY